MEAKRIATTKEDVQSLCKAATTGRWTEVDKNLVSIENMELRDESNRNLLHLAALNELFSRVPKEVITLKILLLRSNENLIRGASVLDILLETNQIKDLPINIKEELLEDEELLYKVASNGELNNLIRGIEKTPSLSKLCKVDKRKNESPLRAFVSLDFRVRNEELPWQIWGSNSKEISKNLEELEKIKALTAMSVVTKLIKKGEKYLRNITELKSQKGINLI